MASELRQAEALQETIKPLAASLVTAIASSSMKNETEIERLQTQLASMTVECDALTPLLGKLAARADKPPEQRLINEATVNRINAVRSWYSTDVQRLVEKCVAAMEKGKQSLKAEAAAVDQQKMFEVERGLLIAAEAQGRDVVVAGSDEPWTRIRKAFKDKKKKIASKDKLSARAAADDSKPPLSTAPSSRTGQPATPSSQKKTTGTSAVESEFLRPFVEGLSMAETHHDERVDFEEEEEDDRDELLHFEIVARRELSDEFDARVEALVQLEQQQAGGPTLQFQARCSVIDVGGGPLKGKQWQVHSRHGAKVHLIENRGSSTASTDNSSVFEPVSGVEMFYSVLQAVSRPIAARNKEELLVLEPSSTLSFGIVLAHGGYFAGGIWDCTKRKWLAHKTISRYVCRRGQGGRQSAHGGRTDTAGSQIRAHHEKKWIEEMKATIEKWDAKYHLSTLAAFFVHAPGSTNYRTVVTETVLASLGAAGTLFPVPVTTGRPLLQECEVVLQQLTTVGVGHFTVSNTA